MKILHIIPFAISALIVGCIGHKVEYIPPQIPAASPNFIDLDISKSEAWTTGIKWLSKDVFVINNLDQTSGLINISFSGNSKWYVDGGEIHSMVSNLRGQREYSFSAASPYQAYEVSDGVGLFLVHRNLNLEGRANILIEEIGLKKCKVTVNVKYIITITKDISSIRGFPQHLSETISFNTGGEAHTSGGTIFKPTNKLETHLLWAFK